MRPVHPGEILREEFLRPLDMSANALAQAIGVPANRISAILSGERGVTADTALRLARAFGTSPEFWLNLQQAYELRLAEQDRETAAALRGIRRLVPAK
jgi:addiction module HigA family antidote